jgi:YVTN family beta-propeller protein
VCGTCVTAFTAIDLSVDPPAQLAQVPLGDLPQAIAMDEERDRAYVAQLGSVVVIDLVSLQVVTTVPTGNRPTPLSDSCGAPFGISVDPTPHRIYSTDPAANMLSVIDGETNTVIAAPSTGARPWGVALLPDLDRAYVANYEANTVSVIDTTTNTPVTAIGVGSGPTNVAVDATTHRVYVANCDGRSVTIIDATTNGLVGAVSLSLRPVHDVFVVP